MSDSAQPYVTENPEVRKPEIEREDIKNSDGSVPVYDADPTRLDLSADQPGESVRVTLDEVVGPDHPAAVIVPPEGRGVPAQLWGDTDKSPLELLDSGEADEATGVLDGETLTAEEAEKKRDEANKS